MKDSYRLYLGMAPVAVLLGIVAFVPDLDRFVSGGVFVWGLPVIGIGTTLLGSLTQFEGRVRLFAFSISLIFSAIAVAVMWQNSTRNVLAGIYIFFPCLYLTLLYALPTKSVGQHKH